MLAHNSLGDRLNSVKNGKVIPEIEKSQDKPNYTEGEIGSDKDKYRGELNSKDKQIGPGLLPINQFIPIEIYSFIKIIGISFLYGEGLCSIFQQDWKILGTIGVGFLLNHLISFILKLINK